MKPKLSSAMPCLSGFDLLHEAAELKEKVRAFETAKAALDGYVMHELEPGVNVFKSKPGAGHAVEHYEVSILKDYHVGSVSSKRIPPSIGPALQNVLHE